MNETTGNLGLPLVQSAQAQKHVTVNEALARLDGLVMPRLSSIGATLPPPAPAPGEVHATGSGAANEWFGHDGELAIFTSGGWVFAGPLAGWRGWDVVAGREVLFDGGGWVAGQVAGAPSGAATRIEVLEFDHAIGTGATSTTTQAIPSHAMVLGVTARVTSEIAGTLTSWRLGVAGADNRFGSGLGLAQGAFARGILGSPVTEFALAPLLLTAEGGDFAGGGVRLAVHHITLTLPAL